MVLVLMAASSLSCAVASEGLSCSGRARPSPQETLSWPETPGPSPAELPIPSAPRDPKPRRPSPLPAGNPKVLGSGLHPRTANPSPRPQRWSPKPSLGPKSSAQRTTVPTGDRDPKYTEPTDRKSSTCAPDFHHRDRVSQMTPNIPSTVSSLSSRVPKDSPPKKPQFPEPMGPPIFPKQESQFCHSEKPHFPQQEGPQIFPTQETPILSAQGPQYCSLCNCNSLSLRNPKHSSNTRTPFPSAQGHQTPPT